MNNRIRRIESLDEYKARIAKEVQEIAECCSTIEGGLTLTKEIAEMGHFAPQFLFQDEEQAHYNHDIAKECQRRLGA